MGNISLTMRNNHPIVLGSDGICVGVGSQLESELETVIKIFKKMRNNQGKIPLPKDLIMAFPFS